MMKELIEIQSKLKAPKNRFNKFGGFAYRSCEDILDAVKPLLKEQKCELVISDDIIEVGGRIYVKATATIINSASEEIKAVGYAREEESKKGMDSSQLTGATSSYARKYALNGLFLIDDNKDADSDEVTQATQATQATPRAKAAPATGLLPPDVAEAIGKAKTKNDLGKIWTNNVALQKDKNFLLVLGDKKKELGIQ